MSGTPRFSVVTITRNNLAGVQSTWRSVAEQDCRDFEWVVVDGASTDGTVAWLDELTDARVAARSAPDEGIYDAMNKGLARAVGQIVVFMNAGDRFANATTLSEVDADQHTRHWPWAFGRMDIVNDNGVVIDSNGRSPFRSQQLRLGMQSIGHQAAFFTRDLVNAVGAFHPEFGIEADQEWMQRAARIHPPAFLNQVLAVAAAGGVSFGGDPCAFVDAAQHMRRAHQDPVGGLWAIDGLVTSLLRLRKRAGYSLWRRRRGGKG